MAGHPKRGGCWRGGIAYGRGVCRPPAGTIYIYICMYVCMYVCMEIYIDSPRFPPSQDLMSSPGYEYQESLNLGPTPLSPEEVGRFFFQGRNYKKWCFCHFNDDFQSLFWVLPLKNTWLFGFCHKMQVFIKRMIFNVKHWDVMVMWTWVSTIFPLCFLGLKMNKTLWLAESHAGTSTIWGIKITAFQTKKASSKIGHQETGFIMNSIQQKPGDSMGFSVGNQWDADILYNFLSPTNG